jgi:hypothetical protein
VAEEEMMNIFWPVFAAILAAAAVIALLVIQRPNLGFVWRIVDLLAGGVFIYAGAIKMIDPVQFATDIDNFQILPWPICAGLAFYLPWLEIFCGLAVVFRLLYRGGLSILIALISIFIIATVAAKVRGLDITCGCFGHASQHWSFPAHMATDLAILGALVVLCIANRSQKAL